MLYIHCRKCIAEKITPEVLEIGVEGSYMSITCRRHGFVHEFFLRNPPKLEGCEMCKTGKEHTH